jgi:hypothetical protein
MSSILRFGSAKRDQLEDATFLLPFVKPDTASTAPTLIASQG